MTIEARLGVFLEALPLAETRQFARRADQRSWQSVWFPEITFGDAFVPAAAAALETSRIQLATGVVGIWSRSPVVMALTAATLNQLSNGRLLLGLGLQARSYVEDWHGAHYQTPVNAMREYVAILRRALAGERVTLEGEVFRVRNFQLHVPPADPPIPIYIAAIGPKMTQLAGEIGDGVLGYFYSLPYFQKVVLPNLQTGAARANRSLENFDIACGLPAIVTADQNGLELIKGQVLMFATAGGSSPFYGESFSRAGFSAPLAEVRERVSRKDMQGALRVITDEMADAFTLAGSREHVRRRLRAYQEAGIKTIVMNPSPPGIYFPLFQGHFPEGVELPPFNYADYLKVIRDVIDFAGDAAVKG